MTTRFDWFVLGLFAIVVFGTLVLTGNLTTGPRIFDDNQIYRLQIDFSEIGLVNALAEEQKSLLSEKRLVPVFCAQKVVQARLFGGNLVAWKIWTGFFSFATMSLLYWSLRLCSFATLESAVFTLITVVGEQSILLWRPIQGEGIGMFFLAAALVAMAMRIRTDRLIYEFTFSLLASLAVLSKESFILVLPGMLFLKVWLTFRLGNSGFRAAIKQSVISIVCLSVVMVFCIAVIKIAFGTTRSVYAGWAGFDVQQFTRIVHQYISVTNGWLLIPLIAIVLSFYRPQRTRHATKNQRRKPGDRNPANDGKSVEQGGNTALVMALLIWALITFPQLLLYMKSGMLGGGHAHYARYILPCLIGYAFLVAEMLRLIRLHSTGLSIRAIVALSIVLVSIVDKGFNAYQDGREFAEYSQTNDQWFESITSHTDTDGPMVLVYANRSDDNGYSTQAALRVYYILDQRHGRKNLYYCPLPPQPTIEQSRSESRRRDTRRHGKRMRPLNALDRADDVQAVLIHHNRAAAPLLERAFLHREGRKFDWHNFRRVVHPHGHISYFRVRSE